MAKTSVWREKYNSIAEYYASKYDPEFYYFDEYQVEIDPDETEEEKNNYNEEEDLFGALEEDNMIVTTWFNEIGNT